MSSTGHQPSEYKRFSLTSAHIEQLKNLASGGVNTSQSALETHGHDESAWPTVLPDAVVYPKSTEEVAVILKYCNSEGIPVIPFGAGTSLEGHILAFYGGISLDLSELHRIIEIRPDDLMVRVEAGVHRVALNEKLAPHGLFFSVDPGADATLGGMAATGAAGTTTVRYGSMRDNVLALTAVLANGDIIHVGRGTRKLSAGYDLTRLLVGSEGTLAVITELTLKLNGTPEKMAAAIARFPNLQSGVEAATAIVRSGIAIARCEFLDPNCIKNINTYSNLALTESPTLLFEFHGSPKGVEEDAKSTQVIVAEFGGTEFEWTTDEGARRKLWEARHHVHWASIAAHPGKRGVSTDSVVPLSLLGEAVGMADKYLTEKGFPYTVLGHVADGNFHTFIITDPEKPEQLDEIREITHELALRIIAMGGTCTGEHGIGAGKIDALVEETGQSAIDVMLGIKNFFDPRHILNPGKILHNTAPKCN
jgi:D-lactate dehydrogenase (cytochrome)